MTEYRAGQRWRTYQGADIEIIEQEGQLAAKSVGGEQIWLGPAEGGIGEIISPRWLPQPSGTLLREGKKDATQVPLPGDTIRTGLQDLGWLPALVLRETGLHVELREHQDKYSPSRRAGLKPHTVKSVYAGNSYFESAPEESTLGPGTFDEVCLRACLHALSAEDYSSFPQKGGQTTPQGWACDQVDENGDERDGLTPESAAICYVEVDERQLYFRDLHEECCARVEA